MLTLNDGRNELWQWDTGRKLTVDAECSQVHFSNKVFGRSIDVDVVDGVAIIPDILLQTDKDLTAWAFVGTAKNGYTKISKVFKVNRRNKPADYVFTPPEQTALQELVERLAAIEEIQDPDAIKNAVEDYLEQNPVEAPVQSVNGKTGKVDLTANDVGAISQDKLQEATNKALAQAKTSGEFDGSDGKSAYQIAVDNGFEGSEAEWLESLKGGGGGTSVSDAVLYTEQELTPEQKAQARKNIGVSTENANTNIKMIAHRGWHETVPQNTIAAFVEAARKGFKWLEIDIRKCADGIYVMSHDNDVTLYNNGTAVSVTVSASAYSDIKGYTWDAQGKYKLCSLQSVFNAMKVYDIQMICDIKNGCNSDIMQIAASCGAVDHVLLSYGSFAAACAESGLLLKYKKVPIRCIPNDYENFDTLVSAITNPIYADVNAYYAVHYQEYLNIALTCGIPILFSGCTLSNTSIWQVIASGAMANNALNISIPEFMDAISNDYDTVCDIALSHNEIHLDIGSTVAIMAESNLASPAGYIYAYSTDPSVVKVKQTSFGNTVTIEATRKAEGTANIIFFCGNGETKTVAVHSDVGSDFVWVIGTTENGGKYKNGSGVYRVTPYKATGVWDADVDTNDSSAVPQDYIGSTLYLPRIPSGAKSMTIPEHDSVMIAPALFASDGNRLYDPGYNTSYIDLTAYPDAVYYGANAKVMKGNSALEISVDPTSPDYQNYVLVNTIRDFVFN